jgi:hypothetical protein
MNHRIFKPLLREAASDPQLTSGSHWKALLFPRLFTPPPSSRLSVTECDPLPAGRMARNVFDGPHDDRRWSFLGAATERVRAVLMYYTSLRERPRLHSHRLAAALRSLPAE